MKNELKIIELLNEIKQEQQKLNQRYDKIDSRLDKIDEVLNPIIELIKLASPNINPLIIKNTEVVAEKTKGSIQEAVDFENLESLWASVLSQMSKEVSKPSFETWFKSTKLLSCSASTATIVAPNSFARDWLENHYGNLTKDVLTRLTGQELLIEFIVQKEIV